MRSFLFALPFLFAASPALAHPDPTDERIELPAELMSPEMGEKMGKMLGALSRSLMDLKIGELEAIAKGREATESERNRTLRDVAPNGGADITRQAERAGPMLQKGMQAMAKALPSIMGAMRNVAEEMEGGIDRATANVPQPGYPKR